MSDWLKASGEMAERIRSYDWASTSLGPIESWPAALRTIVSLCLDSRFPQAVLWGSDLVTLHNDAFKPILGRKPSAIGRPFRDVWSEAWDEISPFAERAQAGQATFIEDFPLTIERGGAPEEAYFTFCYSPIRDDEGKVLGMLDTVTETTPTVNAGRRLRFLDSLNEAVAPVNDPDTVLAITTRLTGEHLGLSKCAYADVDADGDGVTVRGEWIAPGLSPLMGRYRLKEFGNLAVTELRAGRPLIINDHRELAPSAADAFQALGISATLCHPLIKDGGLSALIAVHDEAPRHWSRYERTLLADVTQRCWAHIERVRSEQKLRELNESLEERVRFMVAQYEAEVAESHEHRKMETVGQLTGGIAHDFNNLLTPIMGALELVRRRITEERTRELIDAALHSAERARTLVGRLLTFARRQTLMPQPVQLAELLESMRELIERSLGPRVAVSTEIPCHTPTVLVDPNQLELAILNLAINARDAMPEGGSLEISAMAEEVPGKTVKGMQEGHYVRLRIRDSGVGMSEEVLQRCIEPFFSTKGQGKGTGLGLSMAQGLAAQSGGGLGIISQEGHGTEVSIWLPITNKSALEKGELSTDVPEAPAALRVLLVDDEIVVRRITAAQLEALGYRVFEASSAASAVELINTGLSVDLLVTDHLMPDKTGLQLAQDLRRKKPDLPVLIITGYANVTTDQFQGFDVLPKPFRHVELASALAGLLRGPL
ncbi:response regulator [Escherichia coli]